MKRFLPLLLAVVVCFATACSSNNAGNTTNNQPSTQSTSTESSSTEATSTESTSTTTNDQSDAQSSGISTGLGIVTGIGSSASATDEKAGNAQVDSLIAVVTLDSSGKITKCTIDAAQTRVSFDNSGVITADKSAAIQTKGEKGEGYGMKKASAIGKEWNEQAAAFCEWTIGKTVDEVKGLNTKKVDESHTAVPDVPELTSSVTISVGDFIGAVEKAVANAKAASAGGNYKTGLGVVTGIGSSKDAKEDADGTGQVDSLIAGVTVDDSGKIVACSIDSAQTKVNFNASGELTSDLKADIKSKAELADNYGMKKASSIGKEWYEQASAFAEWTVGKTIDEVKGLQTKKVDDNHTAVPDVPELTSSVTVTVGDFIQAVEKAVANAK